MSFTARLLLLVLLSINSTSAQAQAGEVYCGGVTDVATVELYFANLRLSLAKSGPKTRFNAFVSKTFGVSNNRGRTLYFYVKDVGSVTPGRISTKEWREISRRGARSLHNAGWRGCFMDHGKVWFEVSKESGFQLTQISRDMPWVKPEAGTVMKLAHPAN